MEYINSVWPGLTGSIVKDAVKGKDLSTLTDAELINAIQDEKEIRLTHTLMGQFYK